MMVCTVRSDPYDGCEVSEGLGAGTPGSRRGAKGVAIWSGVGAK